MFRKQKFRFLYKKEKNKLMNRFTNYQDLKKVLIGFLIFFGLISIFMLSSCSDTKEEQISENKRYVRKNIHSNEAVSDVLALDKADHKMSGKSCEKGCCRKLNKDGRPEFQRI